MTRQLKGQLVHLPSAFHRLGKKFSLEPNQGSRNNHSTVEYILVV